MSSFGVDVIPNPGETVLGVPVGTIIQYASSTAPSGYLNCDGSAISRTTYSGLFNLIGTTYGVGDGAQQNTQSWALSGTGSIQLNFNSAYGYNNFIQVGTTFSFNTGSVLYTGLVALSANTTTVVASQTGSATGGVGGYAILTTPTTFNLPNTVGVTIRGSGTSWTIGSTGGADTYALTPANIASHKHDITIVGNGSGAASGGISTSAPPTSGTSYTTGIIYDNSNNVVTTAGSNGASFSTRNAYLVLNYCIKY